MRSMYIDRIYDTYIDEQQLQDCDFTIGKIADGLEPRPYSSRAFIREMGKWLSEGNGKKTTAWSSSPTSTTCRSLPRLHRQLGRLRPRQAPGRRDEARRPLMTLDSIADFRELTDIKIKAAPPAC